MTFTTPQEDRYFEDYLPGPFMSSVPSPSNEAEIIEFAPTLRSAALSHRSGDGEAVRLWGIDRQRLAHRELDHAASG